MPIEHLALPYSRAALEPHLSAATLEAHHGMLHRGDVERLNAIIADSEFAELTLEQLVAQAQGTLFHLAAQVCNHNLYWQCLRPRGGGEPLGRLGDGIARAFGDFALFKQEFNRLALGVAGSGWAWLVQRPDGSLAVVATRNASTPLSGPDTPLLACDLWEHAYYLDYRHDRARYLDAFWKLVNWEFVASRLN
ncbi:superoxide dismutase [Xanthomonas maliensis]|uniref:superoxide dismutase n=1 Tax=Xanthomonas maliensis TaxID=1321368 RepID=UPI0003B67CFE|nr:Fe-Mn family superoxide dismutase [Xanthomonas maliensis]KAB7764079.1 superoxide dismutase [Xanthomonas maliensis]